MTKLAELAGVSARECGQRLIYNPCTIAKFEHNFRELSAAVAKLCEALIPDEQASSIPAPGSFISIATVDAKWEQTSPPRCLAHDGAVSFFLYLLRTWDGDPNVEAGDQIPYALLADGTAYALSDYMDDKIGTIKFWSLSAGSIPRRWAVMDGVANSLAFSGSGINYLSSMIELADITAGTLLSAENTSRLEDEPLHVDWVGPTGMTSIVGPTEVALADWEILFAPPGLTSLEDPKVTLELTQLDCAPESPVMFTNHPGNPETLSSGQHQHAIALDTFFYVNDALAPLNPPLTTDFGGDHTHHFREDEHVHPLTPNPHDHTVIPDQIMPDEHSHDITSQPHDHSFYQHTHGVFQTPHFHIFDPGGHEHTADHSHEGIIEGHEHAGGLPARKQLIPIERIY